jgi:hypothetical protein
MWLCSFFSVTRPSPLSADAGDGKINAEKMKWLSTSLLLVSLKSNNIVVMKPII